MSNKKCTREYHDSFGDDYDKCSQCFVRDNGPWDTNPWLVPVDKFDEALKKLKEELERKEKREVVE